MAKRSKTPSLRTDFTSILKPETPADRKKKATQAAAPSPQSDTALEALDFINNETTDLQALSDVLYVVGGMADKDVDNEDATLLLRGIGIVGRILRGKINAIQEKANDLYDQTNLIRGRARVHEIMASREGDAQ